MSKALLIALAVLAVLVLGILVYFKFFALAFDKPGMIVSGTNGQPSDKTGMVFDLASVLNGTWREQGAEASADYFVIQDRHIALHHADGEEVYASNFSLEPDSEKRFGDGCYLIADDGARLNVGDEYLYFDNGYDRIVHGVPVESGDGDGAREIIYQRG